MCVCPVLVCRYVCDALSTINSRLYYTHIRIPRRRLRVFQLAEYPPNDSFDSQPLTFQTYSSAMEWQSIESSSHQKSLLIWMRFGEARAWNRQSLI